MISSSLEAPSSALTPITAHSFTAGWAVIWRSTSMDDTFSPRRRM